MSVLAMEGVCVSFGGIAAVRDVSMTLHAGEIHGVIGPNGAGKTSLINAITGVVRTLAGSIRLADRDITRLAPEAIALLGVGRTFQHVELFRDETVIENVLTGLYRYHRYGVGSAMFGLVRRAEDQARRAALDLLDAFELTGFADARAGDLPFGVQKRVDLARALAGRPRVLLLDEPVSGMSETEANAAVTAARAFAHERGITLLVIEHNMRVMMRLAERITIMHRGRVIGAGSPAEIASDPTVIDAYLGEAVDA